MIGMVSRATLDAGVQWLLDIRLVPPNSDDIRTIAGGHNAASADSDRRLGLRRAWPETIDHDPWISRIGMKMLSWRVGVRRALAGNAYRGRGGQTSRFRDSLIAWCKLRGDSRSSACVRRCETKIASNDSKLARGALSENG